MNSINFFVSDVHYDVWSLLLSIDEEREEREDFRESFILCSEINVIWITNCSGYFLTNLEIISITYPFIMFIISLVVPSIIIEMYAFYLHYSFNVKKYASSRFICLLIICLFFYIEVLCFFLVNSNFFYLSMLIFYINSFLSL